MLCLIKTTSRGDGTYEQLCIRCGEVEITTTERLYKPCRANSHKPEDCRFRGEEIGLKACETCTGKTKIKLFACSMFEQCTIGKRFEEIAGCSSCPSFLPKVSVIQSELYMEHPHTEQVR